LTAAFDHESKDLGHLQRREHRAKSGRILDGSQSLIQAMS
jgi:hypothetical protein